MCDCLSPTPYWVPDLACATQACARTGNQTSDPLVHRPLPNPLSHTSQGTIKLFYIGLLFYPLSSMKVKTFVLFPALSPWP